MKTIPLTQGQSAIVDDDDYDRLSCYKWCAQKTALGDYYAVRAVPAPELGFRGGRKARKKEHMHRVVLGDVGETDHINRNKLDNRKQNLRLASKSQNLANRGKPKGKYYSSFKGVTWQKRNKKWQSAIGVNGKNLYIGQFNSEIEAATAYDAAALVHFGEFADLNFKAKA